MKRRERRKKRKLQAMRTRRSHPLARRASGRTTSPKRATQKRLRFGRCVMNETFTWSRIDANLIFRPPSGYASFYAADLG
jgi:hypothetical protein